MAAKLQHVPDLFWSFTGVVLLTFRSVKVNPVESGTTISGSPAGAMREVREAAAGSEQIASKPDNNVFPVIFMFMSKVIVVGVL